MNRNIAIFIGIALLVGAYFWFFKNDKTAAVDGGNHIPIVSIKVPTTLSDRANLGKMKYDENCASCHGPNAAGQDGVAPPLIHKIYEPSHHGDESFQRAAALGVRAHHWPFGNMPPVEGITRDEVTLIVSYIRELQRANGIE